MQINLYTEHGEAPAEIVGALGGAFDIHTFGVDSLFGRRPGRITLIDVDLRNPTRAALMKSWLSSKPPGATVVVLARSRQFEDIAAANALGADSVLVPPLTPAALLGALAGHAPISPQRTLDAAVMAGANALDAVFTSIRAGESVSTRAVMQASAEVVGQMEQGGLSNWIDTVRKHHDATYQHCLLVTGVGVAFAQHLGFSAADQTHVSFAGMVHDLGKAKIPLAILEKPGALDEEEWATMAQHPRFGVRALAERTDIDAAILDVVLHHHEYVDGSGYPEQLRGAQVSDLVRLMTIADIFGALMERRSYKAPMTSQAAYDILLKMGPKLDGDMVRVFRDVAHACINSGADLQAAS